MALAPIEDLKIALQEFVASAQPKDGVAYLLNKVDDGLYVPVACSRPDIFEIAPYYLLFSNPPQNEIESGTCYTIKDDVHGWLTSGRIESLVFTNSSERVCQQFTHWTDDQGHSLLLVRSACSNQVPALPPETRSLCGPLLLLVFNRWASTSYEDLLSSIHESKGTVELLNVVKSLVRVLNDRDPFPPYWPFSYFSLKAESGDSKSPPQFSANALGLARWSLKELSELKPWIENMALVTTPKWEDIQDVATHDSLYKEAVDSGDATTKTLVERLKDWIVPVCGFGEWKFYARHNKRKDCQHGSPSDVQYENYRTARVAVANILTHARQSSVTKDTDDTGDFLVTLWALKVDNHNNVLEDIPIGGRVARDFSYVIEGGHVTLPESREYVDGRSRLEIHFAPIPGYDSLTTVNQLEKLTGQALSALQKVDPQAYLRHSLSKIFALHDNWDDYFPSVHTTRKHHVSDCRAKYTPDDFLSLREGVHNALITLAPVLKRETHELPDKSNPALNNWFLHTAKAMSHKRISPELVSLASGKLTTCCLRAYEIVEPRETGWPDDAALWELASDLLYGCVLLARESTGKMNLVECYIREEMPPTDSVQPLLVMRFESDFRPGCTNSRSAAAAFEPPGSPHDGDELRRGCALLGKHAMAQKAGVTHRECKKYTLLFEFKLGDIEN
jgi:hypothetical protein